jgi:hypothetical protein
VKRRMTGDPFRPPRPGTIPRTTLPWMREVNRLVDARKSASSDTLAESGVYNSQYQTLTVRNATVEAIPRFSVLQLGELLFPIDYNSVLKFNQRLANQEEPSVNAEKVSAGYLANSGRWVITQDAIKSGYCGPGLLSGYSWCQVTITDEEHPCASPVSGSLSLASCANGEANIIVKEKTGTGDIWCLVSRTGQVVPRLALFIVRVFKDGGSDGTASTKASWTYHIHDIVTEADLASSAPVIRPRPYGKMTYADDSIGIAYYSAAGVLRLWDAGETPVTSVCT